MNQEEFEFSFPPLEAEEVKKAYESAQVILEYGSGGSTVFAATLPGKKVFSVESDPYWAVRLKQYLSSRELASFVTVYPVDIGPTGKWGRPLSEISWRTFHHYPMKVWDEKDFRHPDVILIDGRFRAACLLYAAMKIEREVTVLFDDYVGREAYRIVENFVQPEKIVGRLAVFKLKPKKFGVELLPYFIQEIGKTIILDNYESSKQAYSSTNFDPYAALRGNQTEEWLEIPKIKSEIQSLKKERKELLKEKLVLEAKYSQIESEKTHMALAVTNLEQRFAKVVDELEQLKKEQQNHAELQSNLDSLKSKYALSESKFKKLKLDNSLHTKALEKRISKMRKTLSEMCEYIDKLHGVLKSAKKWQGRSWMKRAFHKWKAPNITTKNFNKIIEKIDAMEFTPPNLEASASSGESLIKTPSLAAAEQKPQKRKKVVEYAALLTAGELMAKGQLEEAYKYADENVPEEWAYTKELLRANEAISKNDECLWLNHLNAFLANFEIAPIVLRAEGSSIYDRLSTDELPVVKDGPLITVIMPAWNAAKTVQVAASSILNQTWQNLELIIVDDASTDNTWEVLQEIAASDSRVKIKRNPFNVGPYVSKNFALIDAKGEWITGHDSDDWAHPQRLEKHITEVLIQPYQVKASISYMLRMTPQGKFDWFTKVGKFSFDGASRLACISCLFRAEFLQKELGFWDSVRFGADSEMISRATHRLGDEFHSFKSIGMVCLDVETSLTNNAQTGISKTTGLSPSRAQYRDSWVQWHEDTSSPQNFYMPFPLDQYRYDVAQEMRVPLDQIQNLLKPQDS